MQADKLLVCAATMAELSAFFLEGEMAQAQAERGVVWTLAGGVTVAITGVGIPCTLLRLPPILAATGPELVLNIGIAGAYPSSGLAIGDVVTARSEVFADIGFELPAESDFRPVWEAPFGSYYHRLPMAAIPTFDYEPDGYRVVEADGCTVNACTGTARTGRMRERLFGAGIESMEGAAVALACEAAGIPASEVRAISNIAADRAMDPANVGVALANLRDFLQQFRLRQEL